MRDEFPEETALKRSSFVGVELLEAGTGICKTPHYALIFVHGIKRVRAEGVPFSAGRPTRSDSEQG